MSASEAVRPAPSAERAASLRPRSIIWHLALLCTAIFIPALLFGGLMIRTYALSEGARIETQAAGSARELAVAIERHHGQILANLALLAKDYSLPEGRLDEFDRRARLNLASYGYHLALFDREGRRLVDTRLPRGAPLPPAPAAFGLDQVLRTGRPLVSDLFNDPEGAGPIYVVSVPVTVEGALRQVLVAAMTPDTVRNIIAAASLPDSWGAVVFDRAGVIVARRIDHEKFVGKPARGLFDAASGEQGIARGRNAAGEEVVFPYSRLAPSGWLVGVSVPEAALWAPVYRLLWPVIALALSLIVISSALIVLFGQTLVGALNRLVGLARGTSEARPTAVTEINQIGAALVQAWADRAASEARLRQALSIGRAYAFTYDPLSDRIERIGGKPVLGDVAAHTDRAFIAHVHPDDRPIAAGLTRDVSPEHPSYTAEYRFNRPDGRQIWLRETGEAEFDAAGRPVRHTGIVMDITALRQADAALRESEERLRQIAETVEQGFYLFDLEPAPHLVYVSPACGRIWGRPSESIIGDPWTWAQSVHPEDRAAVDAAFSRWLAAPEARFDQQYRIVRPDGTIRWIHDTGGPVHDSAGRIVGLAGTTTDISEARRSQEVQKLLMGELNHRVKNMLATIQAIAGQTLRLSASKEDFVRNFNGRLQALSRANALLTQSSWQGAALADIIREQLIVGAEDANRISFTGPHVMLDPQTALHLALVLHELGTNARKHGALSTPDGRVAIVWNLRDKRLGPGIVLTWQERGGPRVSAPSRKGFGTTLIERSLRQSPGGEASMVYHPDGLTCRLVLPMAEQPGETAMVAA